MLNYMIFFNYYVIITLVLEMKENYAKFLEKIIEELGYKPNLLLHSCCAPCSSYVIEYLHEFFNITILYYNPNIFPEDEYLKRKEEQIKFIKNYDDVKFMDCDYDNEVYNKLVIGLENEPERGRRCNICFKLRIEKTAIYSKENNFDYFGTTLTVSPYKNASLINEIGRELELKYNIKFLYSDFKKGNGYKRSIELSKEHNLYRQNYCGCVHSKRDD